VFRTASRPGRVHMSVSGYNQLVSRGQRVASRPALSPEGVGGGGGGEGERRREGGRVAFAKYAE